MRKCQVAGIAVQLAPTISLLSQMIPPLEHHHDVLLVTLTKILYPYYSLNHMSPLVSVAADRWRQDIDRGIKIDIIFVSIPVCLTLYTTIS